MRTTPKTVIFICLKNKNLCQMFFSTKMFVKCFYWVNTHLKDQGETIIWIYRFIFAVSEHNIFLEMKEVYELKSASFQRQKKKILIRAFMELYRKVYISLSDSKIYFVNLMPLNDFTYDQNTMCGVIWDYTLNIKH